MQHGRWTFPWVVIVALVLCGGGLCGLQVASADQFTGKVVGLSDGDTLSVLRAGKP